MIGAFKNGKKLIKLLQNQKTISVISPVNNQKVSEFIVIMLISRVFGQTILDLDLKF